MDGARSMRAVKDGLPAPSGEGKESECPHWTRAVKGNLITPFDGKKNEQLSVVWVGNYR
jgi:hypothetical protein